MGKRRGGGDDDGVRLMMMMDLGREGGRGVKCC